MQERGGADRAERRDCRGDQAATLGREVGRTVRGDRAQSWPNRTARPSPPGLREGRSRPSGAAGSPSPWAAPSIRCRVGSVATSSAASASTCRRSMRSRPRSPSPSVASRRNCSSSSGSVAAYRGHLVGEIAGGARFGAALVRGRGALVDALAAVRVPRSDDPSRWPGDPPSRAIRSTAAAQRVFGIELGGGVSEVASAGRLVRDPGSEQAIRSGHGRRQAPPRRAGRPASRFRRRGGSGGSADVPPAVPTDDESALGDTNQHSDADA